jgi:molybdate transport system ATP-binding protein
MADLMTRLDLAQLHGEDAEAVIPACVTRHDPEFQLAYLAFPGGTFCVAHSELPVGQQSRLRVLARDVSLTLERQAGTSILNIFPAMVEELLEESPGQVLVRLGLNESKLLSRVTLKSVQALGLAPGVQVFAQVKAVALLD